MNNSNDSVQKPSGIPGNWIRVHRSLKDWHHYDEDPFVRVLLHCLLEVNWAPKTWCGIRIERGQFVTSVERFSRALRLSPKVIRRVFKTLEKEQTLVIKRANGKSLITLCNYVTYNGDISEEGKERAEDGNKKDKGRALEGNGEGTQHNKEEGNIEDLLLSNAGALNDANPDLLPGFEASGREATPKPSGQSDELHSGPNGKDKTPMPPGFAEFWAVYPKRQGKIDAIAVWTKKMKEKTFPPLDVLIDHVKRRSQTEDWTKENGKYVLQPAKFLRGNRWTDEIPTNGASVRPVLSEEERERQKETNRRKRDHMRFVESFREGSYTERSLPPWLPDYYAITDEDRQKNKEAIASEPNVEPMDYPGGSDMKAEDLPEEEREKAANRSAYYLEMLRSCRREHESHRQQIKP